MISEDQAKPIVLFRCTHCGQDFSVPPALAGTPIVCPRCMKTNVVPTESPNYVPEPVPMNDWQSGVVGLVFIGLILIVVVMLTSDLESKERMFIRGATGLGIALAMGLFARSCCWHFALLLGVAILVWFGMNGDLTGIAFGGFLAVTGAVMLPKK